MRSFFRAIAAAIRACVSAGRWVARKTASGIERVWEAMPSFGSAGAASGEPDESDVAQQAAAAEQAAQQRADSRTQVDSVATALRSVARALLERKEPAAADAAALNPALLEYVLKLSPPELKRLVEPTVDARKICKALVGGAVTEGLPKPEAAKARTATPSGSQSEFSRRVAARRAKSETPAVANLVDRYRSAA